MEETMSSKPAPRESFVQLWAGENPALHEALLEELDESGIVFADKALGEGEVAPDPLPIDSKPRFGFEVAAHHAHLPSAHEILQQLLPDAALSHFDLPTEHEPPPDH